MILFGHFIAVLLTASGIQQIRGVCIDQDIVVVELPNQIQRILVFNLDVLQTPGRIQQISRQAIPAAYAV